MNQKSMLYTLDGIGAQKPVHGLFNVGRYLNDVMDEFSVSNVMRFINDDLDRINKNRNPSVYPHYAFKANKDKPFHLDILYVMDNGLNLGGVTILESSEGIFSVTNIVRAPEQQVLL